MELIFCLGSCPHEPMQGQNLLMQDLYKDVIINYLAHLSSLGKTDFFALVIMPNHIHLIGRINEHNGKETMLGFVRTRTLAEVI